MCPHARLWAALEPCAPRSAFCSLARPFSLASCCGLGRRCSLRCLCSLRRLCSLGCHCSLACSWGFVSLSGHVCLGCLEPSRPCALPTLCVLTRGHKGLQGGWTVKRGHGVEPSIGKENLLLAIWVLFIRHLTDLDWCQRDAVKPVSDWLRLNLFFQYIFSPRALHRCGSNAL
jgi:hypothetical protein